MKKFLTILILIIIGIASGCTYFNHEEYTHNHYESKEISTHITSEQFGDIFEKKFINQEFERIEDQLQFDKNNIIETREVISDTQFDYYNDLYNEDNPAPESEESIVSRFVTGDVIYKLQAKNESYSIFSIDRNGTVLTERPMVYGAASAIEEFVIININNNMQEGFTFYTHIPLSYDEFTSTRNIRYNGQTMNELYELDESSFLFSYNNKIGFVAGKDSKKFIIYDGKQISEFYDEILTFSCCAVYQYPLQVDHNGIFLFLAKKGNSYPFVEIHLGLRGN